MMDNIDRIQSLTKIYNYLMRINVDVIDYEQCLIKTLLDICNISDIQIGPIVTQTLLKLLGKEIENLQLTNEKDIKKLANILKELKLKGRAEDLLTKKMFEYNNRPISNSLILYNIPNSGSSVIDPILREILFKYLDYDIFFDPTASKFFPEYINNSRLTYHWTHCEMTLFSECFSKYNYRAVCLFRDPRDILISFSKDLIRNKNLITLMREKS